MPLAVLSLVMSGAMFGLFYSWVCSVMWGLDTVDPRVAIAAMQAMNEAIQNAVFLPAFLGTPVVLAAAGWIAWRRARPAGIAFVAAALVYLLGTLILTMAVNVPMNDALAQVPVPDDQAAAAAIWNAFSPRWQAWNVARTVASGAALALAGWATWRLGRAGHSPERG